MKNVFLTGASSGIGLATAKLLAAEGHEVWGTSRDLQRIPSMPQLHPVHLELRDPRSVEEAFNAALGEASHFDVLINNAGAGHFGPAEGGPLVYPRLAIVVRHRHWRAWHHVRASRSVLALLVCCALVSGTFGAVVIRRPA